ncbi:MAG: lytic murein transglycosylase [Candidatus Paceibacterota bacterium]
MVKKTILFIFLFGMLFFGFKVSDTEALDCIAITPSSPEADKNFCRNELAQIEAELADLLEKQKEQAKNTGTLTGDVNYLNSQIKALQTKIKARGLAIAQLRVSISQKASRIETLNERIDKQHDSLAQLLRNTNDFDNQNLVYLVLSNSDLSDFYHDIESYASIKQAVKQSVDEIRGVKTETEAEKQALEEKRNAETDAKVELENSQKKVSQSEAEKKKLLAISKQKETEYKKLAAEKKARADKIRSALFALRDSKSIPFGTALEYAQAAERATGVRAAFVLAILTQESNLGSNVGTCNRLTDPENKSWEKIMKPERDIEPFKRITDALGLSREGLPLSCPFGSGWGGAMGPAQFIPSTWELYAKKIAKALGFSGMPDPWNARHAFFASSIYLGELGASKGGYTAERTAALKYYAGGNWNKKSNAFYGDQVMARVEKIQADIDYLQNN